MKNILVFIFCILSFGLQANNRSNDKSKEAKAKAKEFLKNKPLEFIENKGQICNTDGNAADNVLFKASFGNCDIYITDKGLSYVFVKSEAGSSKTEVGVVKTRNAAQVAKGSEEAKFKFAEKDENRLISYYRLDMNLEGASINKANIIKEKESKQGHNNYFYPHCTQGIYDVKAYGKITIKNIYKGIDWVIYTNASSKEHPLKYDFVVHPGADYKAIRIKFLNAQDISLTDDETKLNIQTIAGNIEEGNIYSYLKAGEEIKTKYVISNDSSVSYAISAYDSSKTLIIDPLVWATYYGGNASDYSNSICTDSLDNIYITGYSSSTNFPLFQNTGAFYQTTNIGDDIYILKFNNQGIRQWATYYGGSDNDNSFSICSDRQNNIYVTGHLKSLDLPTQQLAGAYYQANFAGGLNDVFILKFNAQGVRLWATYYGGSLGDGAFSICSDSQNNIFIEGFSSSSDFPLQQSAGAYWQAYNSGNYDLFILKFNNQGVRQWATFYGGSGQDLCYVICADSSDNIYMTGLTASNNFPLQQLTGAYWQPTYGGIVDAFILKFNNQGVRQWATYYGGNDSDYGSAVFTDHQNSLYVAGTTASNNFPTQQLSGAYMQTANAGNGDAFLIKFNNQGIRQWATFYGGNGGDWIYSGVSDKYDNIFLTGYTSSTDFPTYQLTGEFWQPTNKGGYSDAFLLSFNKHGIRKWATYYGTVDYDFGISSCVDKQNSVYLLGNCSDTGAYTLDMGNFAYYDNIWNGSTDNYILKLTIPCINVKPSSVQSNRNNICINDTAFITLSAVGGIGDTLKWYSGGCGQTFIGKNNPLTISPPTQTTTYYVRWVSSCDTSDCDSITIYVLPIKDSNINKIMCQGESFFVGIHNYTISGNYIDTLVSNNGCDSIVKTNLTVNPSPIINIGNDTTICEGKQLILDATYPNATYLWQDNSVNPAFNVTEKGLYWVIASIDSCSSMDSIRVVSEDCEIILELPNFFSPNNDAINDVFMPSKIKGIQSMNTLIYNRWGNLIYTSDELKINWCGTTTNGNKVADGVYYWIITYVDRNGKKSGKNGSVTILR